MTPGAGFGRFEIYDEVVGEDVAIPGWNNATKPLDQSGTNYASEVGLGNAVLILVCAKFAAGGTAEYINYVDICPVYWFGGRTPGFAGTIPYRFPDVGQEDVYPKITNSQYASMESIPQHAPVEPMTSFREGVQMVERRQRFFRLPNMRGNFATVTNNSSGSAWDVAVADYLQLLYRFVPNDPAVDPVLHSNEYIQFAVASGGAARTP